MIDGVVYQACADGHVYLPTDDATIPFGTIADFHPSHTLNLSDIPSYETFETRIDELCAEENIPLAIHFIGDFRHMKVRTVARQEKDGTQVLTDICILAKQGAGAEDMIRALAACLVIGPTPDMIACVRELHAVIQPWPIAAAAAGGGTWP